MGEVVPHLAEEHHEIGEVPPQLGQPLPPVLGPQGARVVQQVGQAGEGRAAWGRTLGPALARRQVVAVL